MSAPIFSTNPLDYPDVKSVIDAFNLTPVIIVIGGSYSTNTVTEKSDLDIWGYHLEDEPEEVSIGPDDRLAIFGDADWTQFTSCSLTKGRQMLENPGNDKARRVWVRENFLAQPRIFDSDYAKEFRKELLETPVLTVAQYYLEAGDWYITNWDQERMTLRAFRIFLTGARLLEIGDLIIDYQILMAWAGNPTIAEARERLQAEIDKL